MLTEDFKVELFELPSPELSNLIEIEDLLLQASKSHNGRIKLIEFLSKQTDYLDKLLCLLNDCEDLEDIEDLYKLSNIMRTISKFFLNLFF
jgi:hypothetical protein